MCVLSAAVPGLSPVCGQSTSEMSEEEVDEVENRLRECLFGRRTRLVEFFQQFDRLHSGVITKNQFRQVLDMGSVRVSEREFQGLVCPLSALSQA